MNDDIFVDYVEQQLVPVLKRGDIVAATCSTNSPADPPVPT